MNIFADERAGRYHIEKCRVLCDARRTARRNGLMLFSIAGVKVDEAFFKEFQKNVPVPAKVRGFVISSTVSVQDPNVAPTNDELEKGARVGRKGYVRCVACNCEVFGPNARSHAAVCHPH